MLSISNLCAGQPNVTGPISAGHFSRYGSTTPEPQDNDKDYIGICPKGFYCPLASEDPVPCPLGTYGYG